MLLIADRNAVEVLKAVAPDLEMRGTRGFVPRNEPSSPTYSIEMRRYDPKRERRAIAETAFGDRSTRFIRIAS